MYTQYIYLTRTTTGERPIYTGRVLELPTCFALGTTVEECQQNLNVAQKNHLAQNPDTRTVEPLNNYEKIVFVLR